MSCLCTTRRVIARSPAHLRHFQRSGSRQLSGLAESQTNKSPAQRAHFQQIILAASAGGLLLSFYFFNPTRSPNIQNQQSRDPHPDTPTITKSPPSSSKLIIPISGDGGIYLWGSNKNGIVDPGADTEVVKKPIPLPFFQNEALRDLSLHEKYAVAIDARGDLYQWGTNLAVASKPIRPRGILRDCDIKQVSCTSHKIYALSRSGKIYVMPTGLEVDDEKEDSTSNKLGSNASSTGWWPWWLGGSRDSNRLSLILNIDHPESQLSWREKFTDISAGDHHLLAITSRGRTFSCPVDLQANSHGQLGVKLVKVNSLSKSPCTIPLTPASISSAESDAKNQLKNRLPPQLSWLSDDTSSMKQTPPTELTRSVTVSNESKHSELDLVSENHVGFSTTLHELPALRQLNVVQAACGSRHSLVRTSAGDVLAFGANQFGQLGAGTNLLLPAIPAPTQVDLPRSSNHSTTCVGLAAGGDTSYLVIEKKDARNSKKTIDVLAAGHGQYGGAGNGQWNHQASPVKVKTISGLIEWSEKAQTIFPIGIRKISVGKTHVAAVLDNAVSSDGKKFGRDVFLWGQNAECQLGNQKRANSAIPQHILPLPKSSSKEKNLLLGAEEGIGSGTISPMPHHRLQLEPRKRIAKRDAEETVTTGWGTTAVYWRLLD